MDSITEFVAQWGYIAVFLGALIEGETVIFTAGYMAYKGVLSLPMIMLIAFLGTLLSEQVFYFVGRHYKERIIEKFPRFKPPLIKALEMLKKYDTLFILSSRFIYGIRNASPIAIGMSGTPPRKYIPLNILAAAIWSILSCGGAYLLGSTMEHFFENFNKFQMYFFVAVGLIIALVVAYRIYKRKTNV